MKKIYELSNEHSIIIEDGNRGIADDYKVTFCECGRPLMVEYYSKDAIEDEYDIIV